MRTRRWVARLAFSLASGVAFSAFFAFLTDALAAEPAAAAPATATSSLAALHLPAATETRLDNGLRVVLEESHASPFVWMQLRYDAGSRDDPAGKDGLAAITERVLLRGTKHVPDGAYATTFDRLGALEERWGGTADATLEWTTIPPSGVDSVLWLWSDQMGFFAPSDPKVLADALAEKASERRQKVTGTPLGAVPEIVARALFPEGHPYHAVPLGEAGPAITLDDVRAFHDAKLAPNDAVLVLVGDFSSAKVLERVKTYFGPIAAAPARAEVLAPAQLDGEVRLDVVANVKAAEVWIDWRTPPFFDAGDAELDIAARALVGTRVAALRWALVDATGLATHVTARQVSRALGSDFRITATVANGRRPEELVAGIDQVLDMIRTRGLNEDAFAAARGTVITPYVAGLDDAAHRASIYAELASGGRDPTKIEGDVGRYDVASLSTVNAAFGRWLPKGHRVVTVITPDRAAPMSGELRADAEAATAATAATKRASK